MIQTALDPVTDTITYEYYINQLMVSAYYMVPHILWMERSANMGSRFRQYCVLKKEYSGCIRYHRKQAVRQNITTKFHKLVGTKLSSTHPFCGKMRPYASETVEIVFFSWARPPSYSFLFTPTPYLLCNYPILCAKASYTQLLKSSTLVKFQLINHLPTEIYRDGQLEGF